MIFLPLKINLFRIVVSTLMFVVSGVYSNEIGDSLASINFRISDMKVMAHNYSDFSGEIKSLSCEAIFSFNDSSVDVFTLVIDSIVENNNELIGSCCNSHEGYDSFLELTYTDKSQKRVKFYCKDYRRGILEDQKKQYFVYFSDSYAAKLKGIARSIRKDVCPCRNIERQ